VKVAAPDLLSPFAPKAVADRSGPDSPNAAGTRCSICDRSVPAGALFSPPFSLG